MNRLQIVAVALFFASFVGTRVEADEPGWTWQIVTFGEKREQIQQTPIIYRSYRPLHFYGNTVRRMHYHGSPLPTPRVIVEKLVR